PDSARKHPPSSVAARTCTAELRIHGPAEPHQLAGTGPSGSPLADPRPSLDPPARQPSSRLAIVEHPFASSALRSSELTLFTLVMWPSTGPVLHRYRKAFVIASRSSVMPAARRANGFKSLPAVSSNHCLNAVTSNSWSAARKRWTRL